MYVLHTLGSLDVRSEDGTAVRSVLAQPKRVAVLCYLCAAMPPGFHSRDGLIAMFWPELDDEHARNALNQAVHFLRRSLGSEAILSRDQNDLAVNRELVRCDTAEFERCLDRGALEKALSLYEGDFLQGFHISEATDFERWVDQERARLRELASKTAWELAMRSRTASDLKAAAELAKRSSSLAPYDEDRARDAITLLLDAGQLPVAVAFYEAFAQRLWDDLALKPSAETRALADRARTTAAIPSTRVSAVESPATKVDPPRALSGPHPNLEAKLRSELASDLEVLRFLGRGSTAIAYLAREPALKRLVTVKVLRPELALDGIARQRFEREAQAAARISHTNVASVYRVGHLSDGIPYMVIEYIEGRSLADVLAAGAPLTQEESRRILTALASALAAAHDRGIIHRDVRPANIFLDNRSRRVVLTDFGIAALLDSGGESVRHLTPLGQRVGEIRYMSPEQVRGEQPTELSDVYALGVVGFELLTGQHPMDVGETSGMLLHMRNTANEPAASSDRDAHGLASIMERCLSPDAHGRPRAQDIAFMLGGAR